MSSEFGITIYQRELATEKPKISEFNQRQKKAINDAIKRYFKNNRILFNRENFQRVAAIIGVDCIERGLILSGKEELSEKDNVVSLVKIGLENRNQVRDQSQEALALTRGNWVPSDCPFIGPLALEKELYYQASRVVENFTLTPQVFILDRITYLYQSRRAIIDQIAGFGVSSLPQDIYPDASIDMIQGTAERASIVRNMILAMNFQDSYNPVIEIEELRKIISREKEEVEKILSKDITLEKIKEIIRDNRLSSEEVNDYFNLLKEQIKSVFSNSYRLGLFHTPRAENEMIDLRDKFYANFNPVLLLVHPALEEKAFITNQNNYYPGDYGLWREDFSTIIKGYRVPTKEGLERAMRLAIARGKGYERYKDARALWNRYVLGRGHEAKKLEAIKDDEAETRNLTEAFKNDPDIALPKKAYFIKFVKEQKVVDEETKIRQEIKLAKILIRGVAASRKEAIVYLRELRQTYGGIPDSAPPPKRELLKRLNGAIEGHKGSITITEGKIFTICFQLRGNLLAKLFLPYNFPDLNFKEIDAEKIILQIKLLNDYEEAVITGEYTPTKSLTETEMDTLLNNLGRGIEREIIETKAGKKKKNLPKKDLNYLAFLESLKRRKERLSDRRNKEEYIKDTLLLGLNRNIEKSKTLLEIYTKGEKTKEKLVEKTELKEVLIEGKEVPGGEILWTRTQIQAFIKEAKSIIPDKRKGSIKELLPLADELKSVLSDFDKRKLRLPNIIPGKRELIEVMEDKIQKSRNQLYKLQNKLNEAKGGLADQIRRRIRTQEFKIQTYYEFIDKGINNPLFPLPEGEGLSSTVFRDVLIKRIGYMIAVNKLPGLQEKVKGKREVFEKIMRDRYIESLEIHLKSLIQERSKILEEERSKNFFLNGMRALDFLLPVR